LSRNLHRTWFTVGFKFLINVHSYWLSSFHHLCTHMFLIVAVVLIAYLSHFCKLASKCWLLCDSLSGKLSEFYCISWSYVRLSRIRIPLCYLKLCIFCNVMWHVLMNVSSCALLILVCHCAPPVMLYSSTDSVISPATDICTFLHLICMNFSLLLYCYVDLVLIVWHIVLHRTVVPLTVKYWF